MLAQNQKTISWEALEFKHYPKNPAWYTVFIAVSVMVIAFFIIVESDIFAAVSLAIIAALIIIFSRQKPELVEIELNHKGVRFGNLIYPYKQIKYFWVVHNERHQTLNFHTTAMINNVVILELADKHPDEIRNFLLPYLPEHFETEETSIQRIMHLLKF